MDILSIIILIESVIIIGLIIFLINLKYKIKNLKNELYLIKRNNIHLKSIFQMSLFQIKKYKEGTNPYTVMARLSDLYRDKLK